LEPVSCRALERSSVEEWWTDSVRIQLAAPHRYPASDKQGSGLHPKAYPSGSGYHLHDLLAQGLAEEGHEVFYYLAKGCADSLPAGVTAVPELISDVDLCHAPIGPSGFAESVSQFAFAYGKPCLLTCHIREEGRSAGSNWVFVSETLARTYGSDRVVLNGIDPNDLIFSENKEDYFFFMGAMNKAEVKGLDQALALSRRKGFRLIVAGTGLNYETIYRVAELCRAARAEYVGDVRGLQKAKLLAGARAVLFPSRVGEGCPLVLLEAIMSGTPVISSRAGGTVEIVTSETGFLCDREDEWCAAVDRVSEISPKRCRDVAMEKFHYRRMVRDYFQEYRRELEHFGT
jgi:glycosyltransferase involved in cell wall biosynthesis